MKSFEFPPTKLTIAEVYLLANNKKVLAPKIIFRLMDLERQRKVEILLLDLELRIKWDEQKIPRRTLLI